MRANCALFSYKFVVFKKKEGWRIDSVLSRSGSEEWDRLHL